MFSFVASQFPITHSQGCRPAELALGSCTTLRPIGQITNACAAISTNFYLHAEDSHHTDLHLISDVISDMKQPMKSHSAMLVRDVFPRNTCKLTGKICLLLVKMKVL